MEAKMLLVFDPKKASVYIFKKAVKKFCEHKSEYLAMVALVVCL